MLEGRTHQRSLDDIADPRARLSSSVSLPFVVIAIGRTALVAERCKRVLLDFVDDSITGRSASDREPP